MTDQLDPQNPLCLRSRAWIHDTAGVCGLLDIIADALSRDMPTLVDAYRRCPPDKPHRNRISPGNLERFKTLPTALQSLADRLREGSNLSWETLAEVTGDKALLNKRMPLRDPESLGQPLTAPITPSQPVAIGRALVADDELLMREVIADMLRERGYEVDKVQHGGEAWELLQKQDYQLVLLDFRMPVMHGFEVVERLLENTSDHRPRLIGMTVSPIAEEHQKGLAIGLEDVLVKPVTSEALDAALG